jgi:hypothetical protein
MNITVNRVLYRADELATYLMNITVNRVRDSSGYKGKQQTATAYISLSINPASSVVLEPLE